MLVIPYLLLICWAVLSSGQDCRESGNCVKCDLGELESSSYCRKTGMKIMVLCEEDGEERVHYKSCSDEDNDEQGSVMNVLLFQVMMATVGALAYYGVQSRKQLSMSHFDRRASRI